jgi:hypothetical protein
MKNDNANISFPDVAECPVAWFEKGYSDAPEHKAIVDRNSGRVFSIVSSSYKLISHQDAISQVEHTLEKFPEFREYHIQTEMYGHGARMRRVYRLSEIKVEIEKNDLVNPELCLYNSYDISWPFMVLLGAYRVVCSNGLVVEKQFLNLRKRHVFNFNQIDLKKQVSNALTQVQAQCDRWGKWTDRELTGETYNNVLQAMSFGKKASLKIRERLAKEADGFSEDEIPIMSLWIFFNVLTWYITHHAVSLNHRVEMERRLRSAIHHFN